MVTLQGVMMMSFLFAALLATVALNWETSSLLTRGAMIVFAILTVGAIAWSLMCGSSEYH